MHCTGKHGRRGDRARVGAGGDDGFAGANGCEGTGGDASFSAFRDIDRDESCGVGDVMATPPAGDAWQLDASRVSLKRYLVARVDNGRNNSRSQRTSRRQKEPATEVAAAAGPSHRRPLSATPRAIRILANAGDDAPRRGSAGRWRLAPAAAAAGAAAAAAAAAATGTAARSQTRLLASRVRGPTAATAAAAAAHSGHDRRHRLVRLFRPTLPPCCTRSIATHGGAAPLHNTHPLWCPQGGCSRAHAAAMPRPARSLAPCA